MTFQKQVGGLAPGVAGDMATPDQAIYQVINYTAAEPCTVGNFVFPSVDNPGAMAVPGGSGRPLGLVQRNLSYYRFNIFEAGTLVVPEGTTLTVAVKGDFWVTTSTAATVGQAVFADTTTGAISTGEPGATVEGSIETDWRVKTAGDAGELIIISNWDVAPAAAASNAEPAGPVTVDASQITGVLPVENGGTGLSALGAAGQVLKVNADASALEYAEDAAAASS